MPTLVKLTGTHILAFARHRSLKDAASTSKSSKKNTELVSRYFTFLF